MGLRSSNSDCQVVGTPRGNNKSPQWLNLDLRRRKLMLSTLPLMSMTSREMARLMLSSLVTSSEPATLTPPSRQSPRLEAPPRRDSKDQGGFHDFVEILKLYDKNDDNTMLSHELF